jgi:hypothetical protein
MGLTLTHHGRSTELAPESPSTRTTPLPLGKVASKLLDQAAHAKELCIREKADEIRRHLKTHLDGRTMSDTERSAFTNFVVKALMSSDIGAVDLRDIVTVAEAYVGNMTKLRRSLDEVALRRKYCDAVPAR